MPPKATGGKAMRNATATKEVAPANTTTSNDNNEAAGSIATTSSAPATDLGLVTASAQAGQSQPASSTGVVTRSRSSARRGNANATQPSSTSVDSTSNPQEPQPIAQHEASKEGPQTEGVEDSQTEQVGEPEPEEDEEKKTNGKQPSRPWYPVDYIEREHMITKDKKRVKEYKVRWTNSWVEATDVKPKAKKEWEQKKKLPGEVERLKNREWVLASALEQEETEQLKTSSSAGPSSRRLTADEEAKDGGDQPVPEQQEEIGDTAHDAEQDSDGEQSESDKGDEIGAVAETPGPYTPPTIEDMKGHRRMNKREWQSLKKTPTQHVFDWFECSKEHIQAELEYHLFTQPLVDHDSPDQHPRGQIIFPHHTYKDKEHYALWMSNEQQIPQAFRTVTDLQNYRPAPEKELVLTIIVNHDPKKVPANGLPHVRCGSLCIQGLENLQPLDSSSARPRPRLKKLMRFLTEALTSPIRLCPYWEVRQDGEVGPHMDYIDKEYFFQAREARFTPDGDLVWYQPKQVKPAPAKNVKPAPSGRPSNVDNSKTQAETNKDGANATGAEEDGNGHAEPMDLDESDAVMHDASGRNSAARCESAMDVDVDAGSSALSREAESQGDAAPTNTTPTPTPSKDKGKGKEKEKGKEPEQASGVPSGTVASDQTAATPTTPAATSTAKKGASTGRRRGRGGKK